MSSVSARWSVRARRARNSKTQTNTMAIYPLRKLPELPGAGADRTDLIAGFYLGFSPG